MAQNSKIEWTDHTFNPWWIVKTLVQVVTTRKILLTIGTRDH